MAVGFTWLKKTAPEVYRDWRTFLDHYMDWYDWSYLLLNPDGTAKSKPRASGRTINGTKYKHKDVLNYWLGGQRQLFQTEPPKPRRLSLARIEAATENHEQTIYVCSHPYSRRSFLMIDVDDKEGTYGDAYEVYQYCNALLVDAGMEMYNQPSTFGYGWHGYAFVHYPDHSPEQIRSLYNRLEDYLTERVAAAGYLSSVEVKGHPPIVHNGIYQTCGQLAKFPKLRHNVEDYRRFLYQTPQLNIDRLFALLPSKSSVITTSSRGEGGEGGATPPVSTSVVITTSSREREGGERDNPKQIQIDAFAAVRGQIPSERSERRGQPAERMFKLATSYSRQLGRPATADELLAEYEARGLNTGDDHDGNRQKLAQHNVEWVASTWNTCKAKAGRCFDPADYRQLIQKYVTQTIRDSAKSRVVYSDDDLAICLYVVERAAAKGDYGCPVASFTAMARTLGTDWGAPNTARMRVAAMKRALLEAQLIRIVDDSYHFGNGNGRGKKYDIGRNHPDYRE